VICAIIGGRYDHGKAQGHSTSPQNLQEHRDDDADRDETGRDRDEVPSNTAERDGECAKAEDGDPDAETREPRGHERTLPTGDAP
jgi:hypothetical protein